MHLLHLGLVKEHSVGNVHIILVHESHELVGSYRLNLHSREGELFTSVPRQQFLEQDEVVSDALHYFPEDWVTQASHVHVQNSGDVSVPVTYI